MDTPDEGTKAEPTAKDVPTKEEGPAYGAVMHAFGEGSTVVLNDRAIRKGHQIFRKTLAMYLKDMKCDEFSDHMKDLSRMISVETQTELDGDPQPDGKATPTMLHVAAIRVMTKSKEKPYCGLAIPASDRKSEHERERITTLLQFLLPKVCEDFLGNPGEPNNVVVPDPPKLQSAT
jgi:hypothetical protein